MLKTFFLHIALQESSTNDSTFQLYKQLSFSYPSLVQPLIHERDTVSLLLIRDLLRTDAFQCTYPLRANY